jgi:hypothetical protein
MTIRRPISLMRPEFGAPPATTENHAQLKRQLQLRGGCCERMDTEQRGTHAAPN